MKEETIGKYLNERIKSLVETAIVFDKFLIATHEGMQTDQMAIKQMKQDNPEITAADVKDQILSINKRFYKASLIDSNLKNTACAITELSTVAKALGVEVVVEGENKEAYDLLVDQERDMFTIDKGEIVPLDSELYKSLEEQLLKNASEENTLKANFGHI